MKSNTMRRHAFNQILRQEGGLNDKDHVRSLHMVSPICSAGEGNLRSDPLIAPAWLEMHISNCSLIVLQVTDIRSGYMLGHISGAAGHGRCRG
jgi:hypothetical protein